MPVIFPAYRLSDQQYDQIKDRLPVSGRSKPILRIRGNYCQISFSPTLLLGSCFASRAHWLPPRFSARNSGDRMRYSNPIAGRT